MCGTRHTANNTYEWFGRQQHHHLWVDARNQNIVSDMPGMMLFWHQEPASPARSAQCCHHSKTVQPPVWLQVFEGEVKEVLGLLSSHDVLACVHGSKHHAVSKNARCHDFISPCCTGSLHELDGFRGKPQRQDLWRSSFALKGWKTSQGTQPQIVQSTALTWLGNQTWINKINVYLNRSKDLFAGSCWDALV